MLAAARPMRALESEEEKERLRSVLLFQELDRVVRGDIVDPATGFFPLSIQQDGTIKVLTLSDEAGHKVETGPLALAVHVPLTTVGGLVAGLFEVRCYRDRIDRQRLA